MRKKLERLAGSAGSFTLFTFAESHGKVKTKAELSCSPSCTDKRETDAAYFRFCCREKMTESKETERISREVSALFLSLLE